MRCCEQMSSCWSRWSPSAVSQRLFFALGQHIGRKPVSVVVWCLLAALLAGCGTLWGRRELDPLRLWVPPDSRFASDTVWLQQHFGAAVRPQFLLATAPNVLQPHVLSQLANIHKAIVSTHTPYKNRTLTYEDVCLRVPVISFAARSPRSALDFDEDIFDEQTVDEIDPSIYLDPKIYCSVLESFPLDCLQRSILELWKFDAEVIAESSLEDVIDKLNKTLIGPVLGHPMDYSNTLGGIRRDDRGKIVSAESVLLTWFVHVDISNMDTSLHGNNAGTEVWASETALLWENMFLDVMKTNTSLKNPHFDVYYEAGRSFGDLSNDSMFQDAGKLIIGIGLMFFYIQLILSKFNWVEVKFTLGSVGLLCVGLALLVSCGICSVIGIPFGPVHNSLPFLLMGLGIDDMFIMKACWEQLDEYERTLPLPDQIGLMLQHAGASIIVTSFTDIVAFSVGAITVLPSLQSFCIYAAVGVFFIFIFAVTFYVAIFVLDLRRMAAKRNGVLLCIKHPDYIPSDHKERPISQFILSEMYSKFVFKLPVKVFVILLTVVVTGFSIDGLLRLEQKFDMTWFIPEDSYYSKYMQVRKEYYPDMGYEATVFLGALNYSQELPKIYTMLEKLENETSLVHNFDTWTSPFHTFVLANYKKDIKNVILSDLEWSTYISKFLHSSSGAKYRGKFRFSTDLICGRPAPPIKVSSIDFRFKVFNSSDVYLPAMHHLIGIVEHSNFTTGDEFATLWARVFSNWITDEIIQVEVERNLELALACVMICTFIIIGNFQMCFWIFVCVLLTLVNTCGWMQKMGLTIDIVTCVGLELGIGFCVDYAAHIGHKFLTVEGSLEDRALETVTSIGAAVLYGGGSTLLSLSLLSMSEAYVFKTFFKIFLLVIVFGIFNGLVFLPVVLSLIGPKPLQMHSKRESDSSNRNKKNEKSEPSEVISLNRIE
ncbi:NPC intracellular cholesterol transporter 1-like [Arctopsyche grandis]|uniref:NPC intracellular cholesterol transporter 1-like n=1 Tax=Arctopsyche grandis TaxID=121162 RepID=UPI00406D9279